ncbi:MAG: ester cyclase [Myxococcota bacterium]
MNEQRKKVALVVTNATGPLPSGPTGLFLPELAHPYFALEEGGFSTELVSPAGGKAANDARHLDQFMDDPQVARFYRDSALMALLDATSAPSDLDPAEFAGVVYVGGHGAPFDYRSSPALNSFAEAVYEAGGVVAAVCHGVCGLIDLKTAEGEPLVAGRRVTGFSNEEEGSLREVMPYLLEDELLAQGAVYSRTRSWTSHVVIDGRLVTGQQHRSAEAFSAALLRVLAQGVSADLVRAWFAQLPGLSDDGFARFVAPDVVNHPAPPRLREGLDAFKQVLRYVHRSAPDQRYTVEEVVAEGDLVVARVRWAGSFRGEYLGVVGNGERFDVVQYHTFRLQDGQIAEHWAARDDLSLFRQTGVEPPR